jgi:O-antigen/teichoic acid export membrane protein
MVRNAFHLGIGQLITTALTMLVSAAVARTLGAADFGLIYLLSSVAAFAYVFVDWGHGPYVTREIARHPERSGDLMGSVLVVRACTAVIMAVVALALTWALQYDTRTRWLSALMILALIPQYLSLTYGWCFRGRELMGYDATIQVVLKAVAFVSTMTCLALGGRVLALIPMSTIAGTVTYLVAYRYYRRLQLPALHFSKQTARELIFDGAPMLAMSLAVAAQPYIDANLLYHLTPANVVGWYGASWVIAGTLVAPATILGATMYPRLSKVAHDSGEFRRTLRTGFRPLLLLAVLGAVGAYLFADFAVGVIYSAGKFGPTADVLRAFSPALMLIYVDMMFGYAILAVGKAAQLAKTKIVAVIITTAAELLLIPFFQERTGNGGIGIMLALALGELVMIVGALILIRDLIDSQMLADTVRGVVAGVMTVLLLRYLPSIPPVVGIVACIAVFGTIASLVGLVKQSDIALLSGLRRPEPDAG